MRVTLVTRNDGIDLDYIRTADGRSYAYQAEPREYEIVIRGDGREMSEIAARLRGMPGWPEDVQTMEVEPLDRNFPRQMDIA